MALCRMGLWWVAVVLLLWNPHTQAREYTLKDIHDALFTLMHKMRQTEEKLERHEFRDKVLGEQLKKILIGVDKKQRALEPLTGTISRLDERLSNVETIIYQKEEREKTTQKKTNEVLEGIQRSLQVLTTTVTERLKPAEEIDNNLTTNDDALTRLDATNVKLDMVKGEIEKMKRSLNKEALRGICKDIVSDMKPFERHISDAEKLLSKYEVKLNEYNATKVQADIVPLNEVSLADEAWHNKMTEVMERQEKDIKKIEHLLSDAESMWKDLPRREDLKLATNQTLHAIANATEHNKEIGEKSINKITTKLHEMEVTNEDIQRSLTQGNTLTESAYNEITRNYDQLAKETADNTNAIKKRIEYSVGQILSGVTELVRRQSKNMNSTVHDRLDNIETLMTDNHRTSLGNLTSKIEFEILQVWSQIRVMHSQLVDNKVALTLFTNETEHYQHNNTQTVSKIKEEVTALALNLTELGDNMKYIMGRLTITAEEFGEISKGIADALSDMMKMLQNKKNENEAVAPAPTTTPTVNKPA